MSSAPGATRGITGAALPAEVRAQLRSAARGMLRLGDLTADPGDRTRLAYLAVAVGGFGDREDVREDVEETSAPEADVLQPWREMGSAVMDAPFVEKLGAAVPGAVWSNGWTVTGTDPDRILMTRDGVRAWARPDRVEPSSPASGTEVRVRIPSLSAGIAPGFVVRRSPVPVPEPWTRVYLNLAAAQAPWFLGPLTGEIAAHMPVLSKVAAHPRAFLRRDAGVLYLPTDRVRRALDLVQSAIQRDGIVLDRGTPLLTRRLAPGVATADDPSDLPSPSHGRWVADLVLDAMKDVASQETEEGDPTLDREARVVAALVRRILAAGRDPAAPHLRGRGSGAGPSPD